MSTSYCVKVPFMKISMSLYIKCCCEHVSNGVVRLISVISKLLWNRTPFINVLSKWSFYFFFFLLNQQLACLLLFARCNTFMYFIIVPSLLKRINFIKRKMLCTILIKNVIGHRNQLPFLQL